MWEGNKSQAAVLESVMLELILGCSSKTCNEAVRGDMGLETLQGRRDKSKLKLLQNVHNYLPGLPATSAKIEL